MSVLTIVAVLLALALAIAVGIGLAYVPMRLLVGRMARDIAHFIERQRERRRVARGTPDRRHT